MIIQPTTMNGTATQRKGFTLIELLVAIVILGVLAALLLPAQTRSREAARHTQCKNNLKQIALALHNYESTFGALPPAFTIDGYGKPLHSWRTLILPYLDQAPLYNRIDLSKAWDDPANEEAYKAIVHTYQCPSTVGGPGHTTYMAIVTPNSCLRLTEPRLMSDVTDDRADTVMVIEVDVDHAAHWMSPVDAGGSFMLGLGSKTKFVHSGGMHAAFVDGSVKSISAETPEAERRAMISIAGNDKVNP